MKRMMIVGFASSMAAQGCDPQPPLEATEDFEDPTDRTLLDEEGISDPKAGVWQADADETEIAAKANVSAATAEPARVDSITGDATGVTLRFTVTDSSVDRRRIARMDKEEGFYHAMDSMGSPDGRPGGYTLVDEDVLEGHEYCYRISVWAPGQRVGSSTEAGCVVAADGQPPTPPDGLYLSDRREHSVRVNFTDRSNDESGFVLERRMVVEESVDAWEEVGSVGPRSGTGTESYVHDGNLEMATQYCWRVRATNGQGTRVSLPLCGSTEELMVSDPEVDSSTLENPTLARVTHPEAGALRIEWLEPIADTSSWFVEVYDIEDLYTAVATFPHNDHRSPPDVRQFDTIGDLDPARQYCFRVSRTSSESGNLLCDSPFAERISLADIGPTQTELPTIESIASVSNDVLRVTLSQGRPGTLLDVTRALDGRRTTSLVFRSGAQTADLEVEGGETYCLRTMVTNAFGTRFGPLQCALTDSDPPGTPTGFESVDIEGDVFHLNWNATDDATKYEVYYKENVDQIPWFDNEGTHETYGTSLFHDTTEHSREVCFRVRALNDFGTSSWSATRCGEPIYGAPGGGRGGEVSYSAQLVPDSPPSGPILYGHTVNPNVAGARLRNVHVGGNGFFSVKFLEKATPAACNNPDEGVWVMSGNDLDAGKLDELYGVEEPPLPLSLFACQSGNLDSIPVQITYIKP